MMEIVPLQLTEARNFVVRHSWDWPDMRRAVFALGIASEGALVGALVAEMGDEEQGMEWTIQARVAACAGCGREGLDALADAAWRAAQALGYSGMEVGKSVQYVGRHYGAHLKRKRPTDEGGV